MKQIVEPFIAIMLIPSLVRGLRPAREENIRVEREQRGHGQAASSILTAMVDLDGLSLLAALKRLLS